MNKRIISVLLTLIASLFFAAFSFGQGTTSRLTGTVVDTSGAAVPGAAVNLANTATGISFTTQTGGSGAYTFDLIPAGTYQVTVEKSGFKKFIATDNIVQINQPATVNVVMQVGDVSVQVTVEGAAEVVQSSSSGNIGNTIEQKTLESLPIIGTRGRNPLDLLNYQPGIVNGANTGGGVHVHGSRDRAFNFTLDGIDINESSAGGSNFTPLRPNPDSIQEFQISTTNFTAELGRSSGAQVTFVTRSGTNQFHGSAFEYYQTPRFAANGYSNNLNGRAKDQFVQHIYGGSLGGPLLNPGFGEGTKTRWMRDKAFFFVNLQKLAAYDTALVTRTVYTQSARNGIYRYISGNTTATTPAPLQNAVAGTTTPSVTASGAPVYAACGSPAVFPCMNSVNFLTNTAALAFDPKTSAVLNAMPLPNNFSSVGDGLNTAGYDWGSPQHEKQYDFVSKFDFKINDNNVFYVRYAQGSQTSLGDSGNGGRPVFPNTGNLVDTYRNPKNLAVNYRWSPSATVTNEFIFGVNRFAFSFKTPVPDPTFPFSFNLATTPNTNFTYNARRLNTWQFIDNVTWVKGNHVLKGGINFRFGRQTDDRSSVAGGAIEPTVSLSGVSTTFGIYTIPTTATVAAPGLQSTDLTRLRSTISDFYGKVGTTVTQAYVSNPSNPSAFAPAGTRWNYTAYYPEYDFYWQDSWRVKPNLVFDLGLRYEVKLSPSSDGRPILAPDKAFVAGAAATNSLSWVEKKLFQNDTNNFGPSVGVAWDPWKNGKTSFRANYRLNYDRFPSQLFAANIFQNAPGNTTLASEGGAFGQGGGLLRNIAPVLAGLAPSATATPSALRTPAAFSTNSITLLDPALRYPEVHSWVLSFQRDLWKDTVLEVNYIGKRGLHLFGGYDSNQVNLNATDPRCPGQTFLQAFAAAQNTANTQVCLAGYLVGGADTVANTTLFRSTAQFQTQLSASQNAAASVAQTLSQRTGTQSLATNGFSPNFFQRFTQFTGAVNVLDSNDVSRYNGLEVMLKRRLKNGVNYQLGYTLSKSTDTRSFDPTFSTVSRANAQSASSTPFDINNRKLNNAWSDFDRRHAFQGTFVYELPFGTGKMFASGASRIVDNIIGGWQIAGAFNVASGRPFTVYSGFLSYSNVNQSTANCGGCARDVGKLVQESGTNFFFDATTRALFTSNLTTAGSNGTTGRNYFLAPRQYQLDASFSKQFKIRENVYFDLRADTRNLTNTPNFDLPTFTVSSGTFGRIRDGVINTGRKVQISGKISF